MSMIYKLENKNKCILLLYITVNIVTIGFNGHLL